MGTNIVPVSDGGSGFRVPGSGPGRDGRWSTVLNDSLSETHDGGEGGGSPEERGCLNDWGIHLRPSKRVDPSTSRFTRKRRQSWGVGRETTGDKRVTVRPSCRSGSSCPRKVPRPPSRWTVDDPVSPVSPDHDTPGVSAGASVKVFPVQPEVRTQDYNSPGTREVGSFCRVTSGVGAGGDSTKE